MEIVRPWCYGLRHHQCFKGVLYGKEKIKNALLKYSESNTENWIADINTEYTIKKEQIKKFKKYSTFSTKVFES